MKLLIIIGNSSVGKMTIGQELMKITDLRLFHNHLIIEPVLEVFGRFDNNIIGQLREVVFREFAKSDLYGLIFTYMWAFGEDVYWSERNYIESICEIFRQVDADIYLAEIVASQEVRLQRNVTENRLLHKASKRDIEASNQCVIEADLKYRMESLDGEVPFDNYIKIDNTDLSPETVAKMIKDRFLI